MLTITVAAVQTRTGGLQVARDLIEMAARAGEDQNYQELIRKVETGVNFDKLEKRQSTQGICREMEQHEDPKYEGR